MLSRRSRRSTARASAPSASRPSSCRSPRSGRRATSSSVNENAHTLAALAAGTLQRLLPTSTRARRRPRTPFSTSCGPRPLSPTPTARWWARAGRSPRPSSPRSRPRPFATRIAPHQHWSDGLAFNGADLVDWWQRARTLASVTSDGYRAIKSLVVAKNGLSVTAIFATPYADWDLLFRDVEAPGTTPGCAIANLASRPSLGPYLVDERHAPVASSCA